MPRFMVILHQSPNGFRHVSPEEAQRVTCALLAFAFARVRTVDEVIAEIQAVSRGARQTPG